MISTRTMLLKAILFICFICIKIFSFASKTDTVELTVLTKNVWIHTTYKNLNGDPFPSNGVIIKTKKD